MIKAGIVGSTGYAGAELVRLLLGHPDVEIAWLGSKSYIDKRYSDVFRNMFTLVDDVCLEDNIEKMAEQVDVIFTATPQGYCSSIINENVLRKVKVIDLSADYRIKDVETYQHWYGLVHQSPQFIEESVYGLCEINREEIRTSRLVANPGCFPTCSILSLYPLVKEGVVDTKSIIINACSGTSGAGRGAKVDNLFCEVNENIKAYGVASHRHTPEIEEQLSCAAGKEIILNFTPHLAPMNRGILVTAYANLKETISENETREIYKKYYDKESFVRLLPEGVNPETRWVEGSNFADVNFKIDGRTNRIIAMGAIDNLVKGAAGQAVQNMNIVFGLREETGLMMPPVFP
ncbi:N-acetyl-gamma-glutamyl-phosphate reductase [Parasporobacterium paucivorans]|uniref:N-acetyl-gamma-glutamyl-phosphate reductase n=1 Tax=Parasporobacterium paucivorans DSM 15970 TaxID=1122934 RepID=A0A1M6G8P8_9FIRM|nr:N-acetyl-gamma-glutamyl-phosphate reductase [Parasporobacterium paucivorans]SHJ06321.1 N-acetyl-gamma-glutamyl-phosphate reductase [Parasporobacterium paucivorans DSM 15970]